MWFHFAKISVSSLKKRSYSKVSKAQGIVKIFRLGAKLQLFVYNNGITFKISTLIVGHIQRFVLGKKSDTTNSLYLRPPPTNIVYGTARRWSWTINVIYIDFVQIHKHETTEVYDHISKSHHQYYYISSHTITFFSVNVVSYVIIIAICEKFHIIRIRKMFRFFVWVF